MNWEQPGGKSNLEIVEAENVAEDPSMKKGFHQGRCKGGKRKQETRHGEKWGSNSCKLG